MFEINEKTAIVTGSASGIGLGIAKMLLEKGANVVMSDYNEKALIEQCEILKETFGDKVIYKTVNVAKEEEVKSLIELAVEKYGALDIMVNNAGISGATPVANVETSIEDAKRMFDINVNGVMYGGKYASEQMIKQGNGGTIINTASMSGILGSPGAMGYCGSKHAVIGITKAWALELAQYGIRVNALCPGYIQTGMVNSETMGQQMIDWAMSLSPISAYTKRIGLPEEMAHAVEFMIENTFLTGQYLLVDGGYSIQ